MKVTAKQRRAEAEEEDIQDALGRHSEEMMAALGFQRLPNGASPDEDLQYLYDQIDSQGLAWAYELVEKSEIEEQRSADFFTLYSADIAEGGPSASRPECIWDGAGQITIRSIHELRHALSAKGLSITPAFMAPTMSP